MYQSFLFFFSSRMVKTTDNITTTTTGLGIRVEAKFQNIKQVMLPLVTSFLEGLHPLQEVQQCSVVFRRVAFIVNVQKTSRLIMRQHCFTGDYLDPLNRAKCSKLFHETLNFMFHHATARWTKCTFLPATKVDGWIGSEVVIGIPHTSCLCHEKSKDNKFVGTIEQVNGGSMCVLILRKKTQRARIVSTLALEALEPTVGLAQSSHNRNRRRLAATMALTVPAM